MPFVPTVTSWNAAGPPRRWRGSRRSTRSRSRTRSRSLLVEDRGRCRPSDRRDERRGAERERAVAAARHRSHVARGREHGLALCGGLAKEAIALADEPPENGALPAEIDREADDADVGAIHEPRHRVDDHGPDVHLDPRPWRDRTGPGRI